MNAKLISSQIRNMKNRLLTWTLDFGTGLWTLELDFGLRLWTRTLDLDLDCDKILCRMQNEYLSPVEV